MAQNKTAAAKTARKTIKAPAPQAAPLLVAAEAAKVVEKPTTNVTTPQPRLAAETPSKGYGDLAAVGQDNLEACVEYGTIVAKGVETLGTEVMSFTQASIEADLAAARDIMAAKTLQEALDLQTGSGITHCSISVCDE